MSEGLSRRTLLAGGLAALVTGCMTHPMDKASEAFSEKDYVHSILWLDEAIEHNPRNSEAYYARGRCYFNLHQVDRAIDDYDLAIKLDDSKASYYTSRGFAKYQKGIRPKNLWPVKEALSDFEKAIKIDPNHTDAYAGIAATNHFLGKVNSNVENIRDAYDAIKKAKQLIKEGHNLDTINPEMIRKLDMELRQILKIPSDETI